MVFLKGLRITLPDIIKTIEVKTKFINETGVVCKGKYSDGSDALFIDDYYDGERLCKPTINLSAQDEFPAQGCVFIKDYGENEGILQCLIDNKIISYPRKTVQAGFNKAYECKLL